jgi:hypothetical protein
MRETFKITDPNYEPKFLDLLDHSDYLEAYYALRSVRHHQKEIEEHRKLLRREVNIIRKLAKKAEKGNYK